MKISKTLVTLLLGVASLTSLTGCGTIVNGTHQSVGIASNPSNAHIWLDRTYVGNTPKIIAMSRNDNHFIQIQLEGYQPFEATFSKGMSGWVFGNLVFGGVIGLAVDAISGGLYKLTPDQIQAEMQSNCIAYSKNSKESYITIVLKPDPSWVKIGNLVAVK